MDRRLPTELREVRGIVEVCVLVPCVEVCVLPCPATCVLPCPATCLTHLCNRVPRRRTT